MYKPLSLVYVVFALMVTQVQAEEPQPAAAGVTTTASPSLFIGFHGGLTSGKISPAASPKEGGENASMMAASGFLVGVNFEGNLSSQFRWFVDGMSSSQKVAVATEGGYANSFWVYEKSNYTSHDVGPFSTDVNAIIQSAGFRLGAKYLVTDSGVMRPWIGMGYGIYSWTFEYANSARTKSYGKATGMANGLTYLAGVNFEIDQKTRLVLYGDFASPVINPKIDNLFRTGWTWENPGGSHIFGPYRFGLAVQFAS